MAMNIIYEPAGRAREYAELAANIYAGCDHKCVYCYAPTALRRDREEFKNSTLRKDLMKKLASDVDQMRKNNDQREVLLCFSTDAYQKLNDTHKLARQVIQMFQSNGIRYIILTKGGKRSEQDFDIIDPKLGTYATTLTFTDDEQRKQFEPGASSIPERIDALKHAHALGIKTWVSLEPVFNTEQTLDLIRQTHEFVDLYKVGKLNYMKEEEAKVDWADFAKRAVALLESLGKAYYIKKDLKVFLQ